MSEREETQDLVEVSRESSSAHKAALDEGALVSATLAAQLPAGGVPAVATECPTDGPAVSTALAVRGGPDDQAVVIADASTHAVEGRTQVVDVSTQVPDLDDSVAAFEDWSSYASLQRRKYSENKEKLLRELSDEEERLSRRNSATQLAGAGLGVVFALLALWFPLVAIVGSPIAGYLILDGVRGSREWQKKKRKLELGEFSEISAKIQQWTDEKEAVDRVLRKMEREAYKERLAAVALNQLPQGRKSSRRRRKKRGR